VLFRQVIHGDLGCASYLVGDERSGLAAVIDPKWEVDEYLELAAYHGVRIAHVLETHNHADHRSGRPLLAEHTGATAHVNRLAAVAYPHEAFDDGFELVLGDLLLRAIHTPGHRPEHTAFGLVDRSRTSEIWAVLTGDSLLVGDVARPDLAIEARAGARTLHRSLAERLLKLPSTVEVWPGHLGGSLCGSPAMSRKPSSTIGYERAHNPRLAEDEPAFVRSLLAGRRPKPPNLERLVAVNRGILHEPEPAEPTALAAAAVEAAARGGALIVDVRSSADFDRGHIPGAINIEYARPGFGTSLATLVRPDDEVVLAGTAGADADAATALAAAIGLTCVVGVLDGGVPAWDALHGPLRSVERLSPADLVERLVAEPQLQLIDVRDRDEWRASGLPGSSNHPYGELRAVPPDLDLAQPVATICASGRRAGIAASLLRRLGAERVLHVVDGGVDECRRAGWPRAAG
jgi:hydroxyacylglutathione hydrolase